MIFSRRDAGSSRHAPRHAARRRTREEFGPQETDLDPDEPELPERGPYDVALAPSGVPVLDLGSLQVPVADGVEVQLQAGADGVVQQVTLRHKGSALQLGVFAAPRSEGIWEEVRAEIRQSLAADGVAAREVDGEYGTELLARVRTPQGPTDLRFVGVDGPRWMVRGVYQGPAAVDPAAAGPLAGCLAGLVVDRGSQAMPVRDALPLRLPRDLAEQAGAAGPAGSGSPAGTASAVPVPVESGQRRRRPGHRQPG
ncbi:MAG TPA: DUF3710 domain-containing protein [Micromonosporaceae bacterium]|nr:DUF3710 domain-containing protein [Micromonosporaceae bacterium]